MRGVEREKGFYDSGIKPFVDTFNVKTVDLSWGWGFPAGLVSALGEIYFRSALTAFVLFLEFVGKNFLFRPAFLTIANE